MYPHLIILSNTLYLIQILEPLLNYSNFSTYKNQCLSTSFGMDKFGVYEMVKYFALNLTHKVTLQSVPI